ncbi:MAG: DMT family transporter [Proteobacteria bacterium]|nr:DMT family transporter [Pseudomonadota bacterium]
MSGVPGRAPALAAAKAGAPAGGRTPLGMAAMVAATACFVGMHAVIRYLAQGGLDPFEITFFRNLATVVFLAPLIARGAGAALKTARLGLHAARGTLGAVEQTMFFVAVALSPLADVAAISFTAPLFATLAAVVLLKERMGARRWSALLIGVAGTLMIVRPGMVAVGLGTALLLASSGLYAFATIMTKSLARTESVLTATLYMALFMTPLTGIPALFVWQWPGAAEWLWIALMGTLGTVGTLALVKSFREAEATAVMPLDFTKLLWATLLGFLVFGELPDRWTVAGAGVIFASTTYIAFREVRLRRMGLRRRGGA